MFERLFTSGLYSTRPLARGSGRPCCRWGGKAISGRLGEAAEWLANWQHRYPPRIEKPVLAIFAGSHGLVDEGVSLSTNTDTRAHVDALREGRAPLSAIATQAGANIRVFELALDNPTPSIAVTAAHDVNGNAQRRSLSDLRQLKTSQTCWRWLCQGPGSGRPPPLWLARSMAVRRITGFVRAI